MIPIGELQPGNYNLIIPFYQQNTSDLKINLADPTDWVYMQGDEEDYIDHDPEHDSRQDTEQTHNLPLSIDLSEVPLDGAWTPVCFDSASQKFFLC